MLAQAQDLSQAIRYVWIAALLSLPVALAFGLGLIDLVVNLRKDLLKVLFIIGLQDF